MTESLFSRIEPFLSSVEKPVRYINSEWGSTYKSDASYRYCMVYPDTYEIGQANQAVSILCDIVNSMDGFAAERAYLPWVDMISVLRENNIPLFSLESFAPVKSFDMVGITLPHELAATNVLEFLDLAQIPIHATDRGEDDPIVVAGGPCAYNPEPYACFFDAFCVGEGEESIIEKTTLHKQLKEQGKSRAEILRAFSKLDGIYVPSLYKDNGYAAPIPIDDDVPSVVTRRVFNGFSTSSVSTNPIVPYMDIVHNRYTMEISRGCARGCRFCQAGYIYRPVRERDAHDICDTLLEALKNTGYEETSLSSLSATDHSQIEDILTTLVGEFDGTGTRLSIPSTRADAFAVQMAKLIAGGKKGGLTLAPEAGTQRMRDVINKNVTEDDIFTAIRAAFESGWTHVKLYFMIGLPGETDEDIVGIADLVERCVELAREVAPKSLRGSVRIDASCAMFIPKPFTPFQWAPQISREELVRKQEVLKSHFPRKQAKLAYHDASTSFVEGFLSRGPRDAAKVIEAAWKRGARFDAWTEQFSLDYWTQAAKEVGVDMDAIACADLKPIDTLPWDHISCGVDRSFFEGEYKRAFRGETLPDCTFVGCTGCGLCPNLNTDIDLRGERRG